MSDSEFPTIGKTHTLTALSRLDSHALVAQFQLKLVKGEITSPNLDGKVVRSSDTTLSVGTHERAHVIVNDRSVSRFHCEIELVSGRAEIRDLGSTNGTFVDGVRVLHAVLRDGAVIEIGRTRLKFQFLREQVQVPISPRDHFGLMRGQTAVMRNVFAVLEPAAKTTTTVLLSGETGTGKDLAAESIHQESPRKDGPFVVVDCGAIPANLMEDALFGHERGAFSGAAAAREGVFEAAHGGTLFLDEIGELPLELQPLLLRVLEEKQAKRIGSKSYRKFDVRIVAASNRNLRSDVNAGRFRSDLYYRLAVIEVRLPPLRDRLEDLPLLVDAMSAEIVDDPRRTGLLRSPEFVESLMAHPWPGNLRELRNYLELCAVMQKEMPLQGDAAGDKPATGVTTSTIEYSLPLPDAREAWNDQFEHNYVQEMLVRSAGNVTQAARAAGVDRRYFHRLLQRHKIR